MNTFYLQIDENSEIATDTVDFENSNTALEENDGEENSNAADENRVQEVTETSSTSSSTFTVSSKLATKKRGKSNKRQDEVYEAIEKINKIAENVTKNATSLLENKEDEFDIFGRYIGVTNIARRVFNCCKNKYSKGFIGNSIKSIETANPIFVVLDVQYLRSR
ncbi:unnamed protein product [Danaus chrysippus]|uniref:(African queen) hypothetical protein n=1 Tax=Danaus chrysippus TaxID=151541 RepID=A0A8J2QKR2_9NEOP|nr:unnamed protein product [Danaus chrysippus]